MIGKCQKTKNSLVVGGIFPIFEMFPPKVKELSFYITPPPNPPPYTTKNTIVFVNFCNIFEGRLFQPFQQGRFILWPSQLKNIMKP